MNKTLIQELEERLISAGLASTSEIQGCSDAEIKLLESHLKRKLPALYRNFLTGMGKGAGLFFRGTDLFFPALLELRNYAEELLRENDISWKLPEDACVFLMHQGYQFMYFKTTQGDDPPVFHYLEGNEKSEKKWESFSDFLKQSVHDYEMLKKSANR